MFTRFAISWALNTVFVGILCLVFERLTTLKTVPRDPLHWGFLTGLTLFLGLFSALSSRPEKAQSKFSGEDRPPL